MNKKWIFPILFVTIIFIIVVYSEINRSDKMQNYSTVIGVVVSVTDISGSKFSPTNVYCRYTVNGVNKTGRYGVGNMKFSVGDCVMIKYSVANPSYSEIMYRRGKVICR